VLVVAGNNHGGSNQPLAIKKRKNILMQFFVVVAIAGIKSNM